MSRSSNFMGYRYHAQDDAAAIPGFTSRNREGIRPQTQSNEHIGNHGRLLHSWTNSSRGCILRSSFVLEELFI